MNTFNKCSTLGILWLSLCGIYTTKLTPISPVHLLYIISISYSFIIIFNNPKKNIYIPALIFFLMSILSLLFILNSDMSITLNLLISLSSPLIISILLYEKTISERHINYIFLFYSIIFIIDGVIRILRPEMTNIDKLESLGLTFQIYKVNSFMYPDSNYVGLEAVFLLSVYLYIQNFIQKNKKIKIIIIFLLLCGITLSFSRSNILCSILALFFYIMLNKSKSRYLMLSVILLSIPFITSYIYDYFTSDISFNSKFKIVDISLSHLNDISWFEIFTGYGLGNSITNIGIGAHNLFLTFLLESGLFFFSFFCLFLIYTMKVLGKYSILILLPFILSSLSLGTTAIPYFFSFVFICIFLKKNKLIILKHG